jgi:hypothetical protein
LAVFRVEKTKDYTVMANHHLRNTEISLKAKGLLSLMLSLPDNWDYTTKGLSCICKDGIDSINATIKELETSGYLIRRRIRNDKGKLDTTDAPPKRENPTLDNPVLEKPILETPILVKPKQGEPILGNPHQLSTNTLKTDLLNKEGLSIHPSNPYPSKTETIKKMGYNAIGCNSANEVKELVLKNIEYEYIKHDHNCDQLNEIVDLMVETLCSTKDVINVSGDDYPAQLVKEKLLRINSLHIGYVFECLKKTTTYIRNIKRYLLATLFNAPSTIDNYYSALVKHDFYGAD